MQALHDKTRRWICRTLFVALCLVPTALTLGWIAYRHSPWYRTAQRLYWERLCRDRLGLVATIDGVSQPRGGVVLLSGLSLDDPDSGERVAKIRLVEIAHRNGRVTLILSQPEIRAGQFRRVCQVIHDRGLRMSRLLPPMEWSCGEVTIHGIEQSLTFVDVNGTFRRSGEATLFSVDFRVAGTESPKSAHLEIAREPGDGTPYTRWCLDTGDTPLPCALFADYVPALRRTGSQCRFRGVVQAEETALGWRGDLAGVFDKLDLAEAIESFPVKLSGLASVTVHQAAFEEGRLTQCAGQVTCDGGVVSWALIRSFVDAFRWRVADDQPLKSEGLFRFDQLAFHFELGGQLLEIRGCCDGHPRDPVLMMNRDGPLVLSGDQPSSPIAIAQALSPHGPHLAPISPYAARLVNVLPVPSDEPSHGITAERPRGTLKWRR